MYMPNAWITFVKEWAVKHKMSYGCALSNPMLKRDYQIKKGKTNPVHTEIEQFKMNDEDVASRRLEEVTREKKKQEKKRNLEKDKPIQYVLATKKIRQPAKSRKVVATYRQLLEEYFRIVKSMPVLPASIQYGQPGYIEQKDINPYKGKYPEYRYERQSQYSSLIRSWKSKFDFDSLIEFFLHPGVKAIGGFNETAFVRHADGKWRPTSKYFYDIIKKKMNKHFMNTYFEIELSTETIPRNDTYQWFNYPSIYELIKKEKEINRLIKEKQPYEQLLT